LIPGVAQGHKGVEAGPDYAVLEDVAGVTETRILVSAVRVVTVTRIPKEK
jgi:hypothetical protein